MDFWGPQREQIHVWLLETTVLQIFGRQAVLEILACSQWEERRHQENTPKRLTEAMVGR